MAGWVWVWTTSDVGGRERRQQAAHKTQAAHGYRGRQGGRGLRPGGHLSPVGQGAVEHAPHSSDPQETQETREKQRHSHVAKQAMTIVLDSVRYIGRRGLKS